MRVETLPSPGLLSNGLRIRIEAAKAISSIEINAGIPVNAGKASGAYHLKTFFDACSSSLTSFLDVTEPTLTGTAIAPSSPSRLTLAYSEGLSKKNVPAVSAFAITGQTRTITKVTIDGPYVYLDVSVPFVAGSVSIAYTQPGTANLQDHSANLAASFTATAVTNGVV